MLALAVASPLRADEFLCRGRDPGWELSGQDGKAAFTAEKARRSYSGTATQLSAEGVIVWRGSAAGGDLVAVMLKGACTDPAADAAVTHSGIVSLPSAAVMVGCCTYTPGKLPKPDAQPEALVAATEAAEEPVAVGGPELPPEPEPPPAKVAALPKPEAPAKPAAKKLPGGLVAGARSAIAGSARVRITMRATPDAGGRVIGRIPGGRSVTIDRAVERGGQMWYRIRGIGVPAGAWVRGDMLRGG